jgi:hypothetical protein
MLRTKSRGMTVLTLASYMLAVSASALFHDHRDSDVEQSRQGVSASHSGDDHDCSVCQFLAQKPAPVAKVAPVGLSTLVQELTTPALVQAMPGVFSAWHSRAPPAPA